MPDYKAPLRDMQFILSLSSRTKAEIFKHIALSRPAQPWRSRMREGARMVSGLQTNRRGEGWRMKMLVVECAERKGPHPGFAHLLPPPAGEGDFATHGVNG